MPGRSFWSRYSYTIVTLALFVTALCGQWLFGWYAYLEDQQSHGQAAEVAPYAYQLLRDTFENWQSEFLQLVWQVAGLAMLFHIGSPQSKDGDDRVESKIDEILKSVNTRDGADIIRRLDVTFQRRN